ncbi:hypothetical protein [Reichenbachiella sp.]|uniref:hypothetical protein n=1 Tax=Reichenbachiella sp. TaxID=2184521 RepID=UPI003B5CE50D
MPALNKCFVKQRHFEGSMTGNYPSDFTIIRDVSLVTRTIWRMKIFITSLAIQENENTHLHTIL